MYILVVIIFFFISHKPLCTTFVSTACFLLPSPPYLSHSFLVFFSPFLSPSSCSFFSWKQLKLCNLFLSGVRFMMSSCVIWCSSILFYVSLIHVLAILNFVMYLNIFLMVCHSSLVVDAHKNSSSFFDAHFIGLVFLRKVRPRWCRGYHTRVWIRDSRVRSRPGSMDFFKSVKILSMTSFGREVKPWVSCRRFTACKRTSSRN